MEREIRYYLFGSEHMRRLGQVLEESGCIAGQMLGVSPLSDVDGGSEHTLTSWNTALKEELLRVEADYVVLDLYTASRKLFSVCKRLLTATASNAALIQRGPIAVLDPNVLDEQRVFAALDRLIEALHVCFNYRQIILIHTNLPEFYWIGTAPRMRNNFASYGPRQAWFDRMERYFVEKTHCHVVDVTRCYFHQKEIGRPLTELIYEDRCYRDVAEQICRISRGEAQRTRPNFRYSLQRYTQGRFTLYQRFATIFLDQTYLLDSLVLSSAERFVEDHLDDLAALDALDWTDVNAALAAMDNYRISKTVRKVVYAFARVSAGVYDDRRADYVVMFQNRVVPAVLVDALRKNLAGRDGLVSGQINRENAGYYFAKMMGRKPEHYMTEMTVVKPVLVDIFGSCISRTIFNVEETNFAVNRYWFQVPPFIAGNAKVSYPDDMFPEKPHWADRLVRDQFDGVIPGQMEQSQAQWLVVDLFTFVTVVQFRYKGCYYTDFNTRISKRLGAESVMVCDNPAVLGTWEEILEKMEGWFTAVRNKYGNRIILVNGQRSQYWIGDDDIIYCQKGKDQGTAFLERAFRDVAKRLDCYCIDTYHPFLPDEQAYISNTPAHKETECYCYAHELVRKITEEVPEQKYYSHIPGAIQLRRLRRLMAKNPPERIEAALSLSELDCCVIRLAPETMDYFHGKLEALYEAGIQSLEELKRRKGESDSLLAELMSAWEQCQREPKAAAFDEDYKKYPVDGSVIGPGDGFTMPLFRRIELRELVCDRNSVRLKCATAPNTPVVVFRRSAFSDWKLVTRGVAGYIYDTEVEPLTEYSYVVCTEAEVGGKRYISNFTQPQRIRTGVDVPTLTSVITLGGRNYLTWDRVEGAEGYYIYRKKAETDGWFRCATLSGDVTQWDEPAENGTWYTLRAFQGLGADQVASNHRPGTKTEQL